MNTPRTPKTLLFTVHGSHLYGLAHAGSDHDTYRVVDQASRKAKQTIRDGEDVMVVTLAEFVRQVHKGVPQSLEALFSPVADRAALDAYRKRFYPDTNAVLHVYRRTMKSFALGGTFKTRRHALRLAVNLDEMLTRGRFCPTLTPGVATELTTLAQSDPHTYAAALRALSPVDPLYGVEEERVVAAWAP